MKKTMIDLFKGLLVLVILGFSMAMYAQPNYDALSQVASATGTVYTSVGHEELGRELGGLIDEANAFMESLVGDPAPNPIILVLSQNDWGSYTNAQLPYGMPHYGYGGTTLVVSAEDNDFWRNFIPPMDQLSAEKQQAFREAYTNKEGTLTTRPFFDLLAIHELGHGWTGRHKVKLQRFWLEEVFVNVFLHTFIAEKRPDLLPALEVLPMINALGGSSGFEYTTLKQFEESYHIIGRNAPVNYGWYQFRFHYASKLVYEQAGTAALKNLWAFLAGQTEVLDDDTLLYGLHSQVHPGMADVQRNWGE